VLPASAVVVAEQVGEAAVVVAGKHFNEVLL
jgi:hypothetical protein